MDYPVDPQAVKTMLFICTGNVCRSPFASRLLQKLLNPACKVRVLSTGTSASPGSTATPEAATEAMNYGVNLEDHRAQPLTLNILEQADLVFTMEDSQRSMILMVRPEWANKVFALDAVRPDGIADQGDDLIDPYGLGPEVYKDVFAKINERVVTLAAWINASIPA